MDGILDRSKVAHITNEELYLSCNIRHGSLKFMPHIILLFFVTGKNADFSNIGGKKTVQDRIAERTGAAGDEKRFIFKHCRLA